MKKSVSKKIIAALLVFVFIFGDMALLLRYRYSDSITSIRQFYRQTENSVDVLGLGTSHIYEGFSPAVLYREYGVAAYDLCAPAQAVWNSYYYFVEALKTQKPKAVVFDVYMLNTMSEYDTTANAIKTTYGMKWSKNRLHAMQAAFPEKDLQNMLIDFYQYHSRYAELEAEDLLSDNGNPLYYGESYKGFVTYDKTEPLQAHDVSVWTETRDFSEKHERYFRAIIELAIENNIPLYVVSVPYDIASDTQKTVNRAEQIVAEYADRGKVRFIDFNKHYAQMQLDHATDFSGKQHLNIFGAVKFTSYFGSVLKAELNLPDHRGDAAYASWEENANIFYRIYGNSQLRRVTEKSQYINTLKTLDESYEIAVVQNTAISDESLDYDRQLENDEIPEIPDNMTEEEYQELLMYRIRAKINSPSPADMKSMFNIDDAPIQGGAWILRDGFAEFIGANKKHYNKYRFYGRKNNLCLSAAGQAPQDDTYHTGKLVYNGKEYTVSNGLIILVYDRYLDELADCITIPATSNTIKRT